MTRRQPCNVYFAACAKNGGVWHYVQNENGTLTFVKKYPLDRPMFLAVDGGKMYVLLREMEEGTYRSGMMTFDIAADGSLSNPSPVILSEGKCACHISLSGGKAYAVNYLSGSVVRFGESAVDASDRHEGRGPHPTRQEGPHTHFVRETPDGKYLFCVDLGLDTVYVYDKELNVVSTAQVPAGAGCRHLDYSPDGKFVYCANELGSSVTVFAYADGKLTALDTYPALPADFTEQSTAAAIRVSEDGKVVYVSHRGHDSICAFRVTDGGAKLASPVWTKVNGVSPRDFLIVNGMLYATNEKTDNVTVFKVDGQTLTATGEALSMPAPLCCAAE